MSPNVIEGDLLQGWPFVDQYIMVGYTIYFSHDF